MSVLGTGADLRTKTFQAQGVEKLDEMINEWFKDNPDIRVLDRDYRIQTTGPPRAPIYSTQILYSLEI